MSTEASGDPQEIWVVGIDGKHARRLVRSLDPGPQDIMSGMADLFLPKFSIDGRAIYFMSGCGMVQSCIHKVDVRTRKVQTLVGANGMEVLRSGRHAGYLLVQKHQYYPEGGSYEEVWLVSPDGQPVRDIGPGEFAPGCNRAIVGFKRHDARLRKRKYAARPSRKAHGRTVQSARLTRATCPEERPQVRARNDPFGPLRGGSDKGCSVSNSS